jgi:energy-coupling factor transporter transmembrane protein EcfT
MKSSGEFMDRNRYTWNSQIGSLSKKQFFLLSLTSCFGAFLVSDGDLSRTFKEIVLGFAVSSISFQLLMWRNDINNYLLFLKQSLNKNIKNTMNIHGEQVDLRNHRDEKMERYLEVHGKSDTKTKKIIVAFAIAFIAFLIQYFLLKTMSIPFYSIVGLAMTMALTNTYGELLAPIFLQFIMVLFRINEYNKQIFIYLFIYIVLLFYCISSQYLLETSFYRNAKKNLTSFTKTRILKIIKSVGLLFLFVALTNHFLPGNAHWFEKLLESSSESKNKKNHNHNNKLNSPKANDLRENNSKEELNYDQYKFNKEQKEELADLEGNLEQFKKKLKHSKNLIKHIATMQIFENLDLSSYVNEFDKKQSKLQLNIDSLTKDINQLKNQKNMSIEDLSSLLDQLKDVKQEMSDLKEYSRNFKTSDSKSKVANGSNYQELDDMLKNMNTSLDDTGESVEKMKSLLKENANQISNNLSQLDSTENESKKTSDGMINEEGKKEERNEEKKKEEKKEEFNWSTLIRMVMIILAFIVINKFIQIFTNKKIQTKSDKKIKKKWAKELKLLNKKKLDPEQEIILTYHLLHTFLEKKHYDEIGENAPPALILYLDKLEYYNKIEKQFYYITDLFMRCRYGHENILLKDLRLFRKYVKYSFRRI